MIVFSLCHLHCDFAVHCLASWWVLEPRVLCVVLYEFYVSKGMIKRVLVPSTPIR